jgi:hypothetical protein
MSTGIKLRSLNNSSLVNRRFIGPSWIEKVIHKPAFHICAGENAARFDPIDRKNGSDLENRAEKAPNFSCTQIPVP